MGDGRPVTSIELAERTGLAERYVREWLHNQAAAGWITYDPAPAPSRLPPEHALLVADEDAPTFLLGGFDFVASTWADEDTDDGRLPHRRRHRLAPARPPPLQWHRALLPPRLPGQPGRLLAPRPRRCGRRELEQGARVADVGCGYGAATILLGEAFPKVDVRRLRLPRRVDRAAAAGRRPRPAWPIGSPSSGRRQDFPGTYDLVCLFDCLHDMGDPVGAAAPRAGADRTGRHVAARRARGRRSARGQPPSARTRSSTRPRP